MKPARLFDLFRKAAMAWVDDFAPSMGAAISYYTVFSLAPLLVIVIAVAGALFGREAVQGEIVTQLSGLMGRDAAVSVQNMVKSASEPGKGLVAGLISAVVLLLGATTVFAELQSALDRIWHVPEAEKPTGIWAILRARVLSFGLILGLAFLLMVSLMVSTGVAAFGGWIGGLMPGWEVLLIGINLLISVSITTVLFAMIFKFMPTADVGWRDVGIGAVVTAVLFEIGKQLIGIYLNKSGMSESLAAAGSLVVLLAWVYYAAQIFLLGAEFTKVYAHEHGSAAGVKAVAATKVAAATAAAGTSAIQHPASKTEPPSPPDYSGLAQAAATQKEIDMRVQEAAVALIPKLILFATVTLVSGAINRWQKRQKRQKRSSPATHNKAPDHSKNRTTRRPG